MLIEEKRFMAEMSWSQKQLFKFLCSRLIYDPKFYGFFLIQFERTCPDDGKIYINRTEVSRDILIDFLRFNFKVVSEDGRKKLCFKQQLTSTTK